MTNKSWSLVLQMKNLFHKSQLKKNVISALNQRALQQGIVLPKLNRCSDYS